MRGPWRRPGAYRSPPTTPATCSSLINIPTSAFPGLGLKRGLGEDAVVAPYATALAAIIDPVAAARNFTRLAALRRARPLRILSRRSTSRRVDCSDGQKVAIVRAFMAHHQGMTIVAIADALLGGRDAGAVPRGADRARGGTAPARAHAPRDRRRRRHGRARRSPTPGSASSRRSAAGGRPTRMPRLRPRIFFRTAATASCSPPPARVTAAGGTSR